MRLINRIEKLEKTERPPSIFWRNQDETLGQMLVRYGIDRLPEYAFAICWK